MTDKSLDSEFVLEEFQSYLSTLEDDKAKHNAVFAKLTQEISKYSDISKALSCTENALKLYKNYEDVIPLLTDPAELCKLLSNDM